MRIIVLFIAAAMAGCAGPKRMDFDQGSASKKQFNRDHYECARDALSFPGRTNVQFCLYQRCMEAAGYEPEKKADNEGTCQ